MTKLRMDSYGVWVHARSRKEDRAIRVWPPSSPREAAIRKRRSIVRQAYFLIRNDKDRHDTMWIFVRALGGKTDLTDEILEAARQVIADHHGAVLQ